MGVVPPPHGQRPANWYRLGVDLDQLRALVSVVDRGSFVTASQALGVSRATLRSKIEALEEELGMQLLVRSKRGTKATEAGQRFATRARVLLRDADSLAHFAESETGTVRGELRALLPIGLPSAMNARFVAQARERHPELRLRIDLCEDPLSVTHEPYDLIIHFGEGVSSGPYRTFVLTHLPLRALASPAYLDAHGRPERPDDLARHALSSWLYPGSEATAWPLREGGSVTVEPHVSSSDAFMLRLIASAGRGIALLPYSELTRSISPGADLEPVLPDILGGETSVRVLLPEATSAMPRSRAAAELSREVAAGLLGVSFSEL